MKAGSSIKVTPSTYVAGECFFCREDVATTRHPSRGWMAKPYFIMLVPVISRTGRVTGEGRYTMVCDRCEASCSELKGEEI